MDRADLPRHHRRRGAVLAIHVGLRWLPPTTTVLYLPPNLIAAMVLGIVALGECLTDELLAGMAFVLMGIAVGSSAYANLRKARARLSG